MPNLADPIEISRPNSAVEPSEVFLRLDRPVSDERLPLGRPVTVAGRALAVKPIAEIVVELAGVVARATFGIHRPDLAKAFPSYPQVANSGFFCVIASAATGKSADLTVTVRTVNGLEKAVAVALTFEDVPQALRPAPVTCDHNDTSEGRGRREAAGEGGGQARKDRTHSG